MGQLTVFHNLALFDPEPRGEACLVVAGGRVIAVSGGTPGNIGGDLEVDWVDCQGHTAVPGFLDNHVHVAGGGGAAGFGSRSRPLRPSDFVGGSTTTVVGMLGFDSTTRTLRGLLADIKALRACGLGAYALVGSTRAHPVPTLTGSIADDIVFVDEVLGAGEISLSELGYEFDSFHSGLQYVATVASEAILAGRLAGTPGYVCLQIPPHVGRTMAGLSELTGTTGIPARHLLPSHVNQSEGYLTRAIDWGRDGGWVDVGTGYRPDRGFRRAVDPSDAVAQLIEGGVDPGRILLSSDGNGVVPDSDGVPVYMPTDTLHEVWRRLVTERSMPVGLSLQLVTRNVAEFLGATRKGRIAAGTDADFVLLDDDLRVVETFVAGRPLREIVAAAGARLPAASADAMGAAL